MKSIMEEASTIAKAIESAWNRAGKPHDFQVKVLEYPETSFFGLKTAKSAKIAFFFSEESVRQAPKPAAAARPSRQPAVARPVANKAPERAERPERQPREGQERRSQQRSEHPRRDRQDNRGEQRAERTERPERAERRPYEPRTQEQREQRSLERTEQQNSYESRTHEQREPRIERTEQRTEQQSSYEPRNHEQREPREHRSPERSERTEHRSSYEPRNYEHREQRSHDRNDRDRHDTKDVWTPEMVTAAQDWLKETVALMGHPDAQIIPQVSYNYLKLQLDTQISPDARQEELQLKSWGSLLIEALREKFNKPLRNLRIIIESRQN